MSAKTENVTTPVTDRRLAGMHDDAVCDLCDRVAWRVVTCRARRWPRKLAAAREELGRLCRELGRRRERDRVRRVAESN
jgi:hypothetical protein